MLTAVEATEKGREEEVMALGQLIAADDSKRSGRKPATQCVFYTMLFNRGLNEMFFELFSESALCIQRQAEEREHHPGM